MPFWKVQGWPFAAVIASWGTAAIGKIVAKELDDC